MTLVSNDATLTATDRTLDELLAARKPTLLLLWNGDSLRSDLKTELDKIATESGRRIQIVKVNTHDNPIAAERFEVDKHPVLVGWNEGQIIARRSKPWGADARGMAEQLVALAPPEPAPKGLPAVPGKNGAAVQNKPVHVTEATFEATVLNSPVPAVVDFWATWCGPCRQIAPALEKLAVEFAGKVLIAKVDVDANPGLAQAFNVQSIPYLLFVKGRKLFKQFVGVQPEMTLRQTIQRMIAA